jgi:hypothetical protein
MFNRFDVQSSIFDRLHYLFAALFLVLLFSCSPYKRITNREPKTHKDSVNLAAVANRVFPVKIDSAKKTTTTTVKANDAREQYRKKVASSLKEKEIILKEVITKYKDTCSQVIQDVEDVCNACYANGLYDGKLSAEPDTLQIETTITKTVEFPEKILIEQDKAQKATARAEKAEKSASNKQTIIWCLFGFILVFAVMFYLIVKALFKTKMKAV